MKNKKIIAIIILIILTISIIIGICKKNVQTEELQSIKSEKQLMSIYNNQNDKGSIIPKILGGIPYACLETGFLMGGVNGSLGVTTDSSTITNGGINSVLESADSTSTAEKGNSNQKESTSSENDYSTTNIQVENVDEADITKTDGNYVYSISENNVLITNVENPENMKIEASLSNPGYVPEDIILYNGKLVVISTNYTSSSQYTYYSKYSNDNTMVTTYDISDKTRIKKVNEYVVYSRYYTSRCINGQLLVICSDMLRKENDKIVTYYMENNEKKEIGLNNIKYLKGEATNYQTIIASTNLNTNESVKLSEYLFNIENAYVSENNIYLVNSEYNNNKIPIFENIKNLLLKGIIGYIRNIEMADYDYNKYTTIYKFKINDDGSLKYNNKTKEEGSTINQFSLDEYQNKLRVALSGNEGSRIVIFDENLKEIGSTEYLSKGERMYSTRFLGNKAYMVTYKNTDPLYAIDLSIPTSPKVLGELKIPGYSTYLHPYDENHLIGIGMETKEKVYRDSFGKVKRTTAIITGMKMALFDVSDINNPIQISKTVIGDSRTTSAILTNHKALLFSKEKGLLAIPVNKYESDFEINVNNEDNISDMESIYTKYNKTYTAEGYFVYNINLTDGFKLKGIIEHEKNTSIGYSYGESKLLRGLWINDNLFTVSEDMIKVNKLDDLSLISELKYKNR